MWQARTFPYPIHTIHKSPGRIPYSGPRYLILVLGFAAVYLIRPYTLFWSSGLSIVVCWRWCATVYVLENSLQQPTPNSAGPVFSWTRRWLPAISATVMVRFTVHHRRTLL